MTGEPLRILTINTAKCDGPYRARIARLAGEISRLQVDVIACQEAFRDESGAHDTAAVLSSALGYDCHWAPARYKRRVCEGVEVAGWSGMALLSRRPFAYTDVMALPEDERDGERVAQIGLLEVGDTRIVIANVHLTHLPDAPDLRLAQLRDVLGHPLLRMQRVLRLVCGDFNMTLDTETLQAAAGGIGASSLQDAVLLGGQRADTARPTLPPRGGRPGRRIDYILSLADEATGHPIFTSPAVVLDQPDPVTGSLPSDHYGVAVTLVPIRFPAWRREEDVYV